MMLNRFRIAIVSVILGNVLLGAPALALSTTNLGPLANLQLSLATLSVSAPGQVGIAVEDIPTGRRADINGAANMPAASVIKIPVMVEVFREMAQGSMDLNDHITLEAHDKDWGWGDLADAHVGTSYSINTLLRLMITESDNTATNMLIRRVSRQKINAEMRSLALRTTVLGDDIRSDGDIRSLRTSPDDMVSLLAEMFHDKLIDAWSSREMIAILAGQQHNGLLPVPLPRGIEIAHKTGTLHDTLNDVGIVFLNNDPYAIAVMTTHLPTLDAGRMFIRNVSKVAYDAFAHGHPGDNLLSDPLSLPVSVVHPVLKNTPYFGETAGINNDDNSNDDTAVNMPAAPAKLTTVVATHEAPIKQTPSVSNSPSATVAKEASHAASAPDAPEMQMWSGGGGSSDLSGR